MLRNRLIILSSLLVFAVGCTNTINTGKPQVSPTVIQTVSASPIPTGSQSISSTAIPISTPTPTILPISTPTPMVTSTPIADNKTKILSIGINDPFIRLTDKKVTETENERNARIKELNILSPNFVIVDYHQTLIDDNMDGTIRESWAFYDDIITGMEEKNVKVIFNIPFYKSFEELPEPNFANYLSFISESSERYKDKNIAWMVGNQINTLSSSGNVQKNYMTFLSQTNRVIKEQSPNAKVYAGSIIQGEISGGNYEKTMDEFLSFINMGLAKYSDGFVFEIYSFAKGVDNTDTSSIFGYTDYKLLGNYYNAIKDLLEFKKLTNKEIILSTGTFGGETIENIKQTEEDQSYDILKRFVYGTSLGFDKIYLPKLVDNDFTESLNFINSSGLIRNYNTINIKKDAYYTYEMIATKLKNAVYKGQIPNLPLYKDGYIFETSKNIYYIIWNNDKDINDKEISEYYVKIELKSPKGKLYTNRTVVNFDMGTKKEFEINFRIDPLVPRIIEIEK